MVSLNMKKNQKLEFRVNAQTIELCYMLCVHIHRYIEKHTNAQVHTITHKSLGLLAPSSCESTRGNRIDPHSFQY